MITNPLIEQGRQEGVQLGRQEGIQLGFQQGRQQELQESVVRILSHRFRQIPQDLQQKISSLNDIRKLRNLLDASVEVKSLEELQANGFFDE